MTIERNKIITVQAGDTLSKIAKKKGTTVNKILDLNPNLHNPDVLIVGQKLKIPSKDVEFSVRFVNLLDQAPAGIKFKIQQAEIQLAQGRVTEQSNEFSITAELNSKLSVWAKKIGDFDFLKVAELNVIDTPPIVILKLNSVKINSKTELHPKKNSESLISAEHQAMPSQTPINDGSAKKEQGLTYVIGTNTKSEPEHKVLDRGCSCDKDINIDQLAAIFPNRKKANLEEFIVHINSMFKRYQINTCLRKAHALTQIGHESGSLRYLAEILPKGKKEADVYDGYKGRGLIQITYKKNYDAYGKYVNENFLGYNKMKLEEPKWATDSAGWYWNYGTSIDLNNYADTSDLLAISFGINGGFNGLDDRIDVFKRAHKTLRVLSCLSSNATDSEYAPFSKSAVYNKRDAAFAWGLWSDPKSNKKGVFKNADNSKAGYARFLELNNEVPIRRARYGFKSTEAMIFLAKERAK
ncbi:LysM peptidoglycan-binding domain-containing protein [Flavobacterium sp.]|uniref:LysM peptidoglycan-binding domain-containing protein n=1 Tax=Flavobacterium sp. TaxID=239 RepID=UPI0025C42873|nr:LysM peptidoglycan-binding domain-containing protein [Flavobacterium sp.]